MTKKLYRIILVSIFSGLMVGAGFAPVKAESKDGYVRGQPLQVTIRPRKPKIREESNLITPEMREKINQNSLDFRWQDILDHRFLSGHQDEEEMRQFGYSVNSDLGRILREKQIITSDPDNIRMQTDYKDRQIYQAASVILPNPMRELRQGCKSQKSEYCSYTEYGQYWLKFNMQGIDRDRSRADDSLVNLLKSLE